LNLPSAESALGSNCSKLPTAAETLFVSTPDTQPAPRSPAAGRSTRGELVASRSGLIVSVILFLRAHSRERCVQAISNTGAAEPRRSKRRRRPTFSPVNLIHTVAIRDPRIHLFKI
jgi:hypothetical protein